MSNKRDQRAMAGENGRDSSAQQVDRERAHATFCAIRGSIQLESRSQPGLRAKVGMVVGLVPLLSRVWASSNWIVLSESTSLVKGQLLLLIGDKKGKLTTDETLGGWNALVERDMFHAITR